jgi:hypothetical protein
MKKKIRVLLEFPEERIKEIDILMEKTNTATRKDYFNNALTLLEWAIKESERSRNIASIDKKAGRFSELQMPILSSVYSELANKEELTSDILDLVASN